MGAADSAECTIFDKHMILLPFYIFSPGINFFICVYLLFMFPFIFFGDGFVLRFFDIIIYSYYILCLYVVDSQWVQSIYEVAFAYCFLQMHLDIGLNPKVLIFIYFFVSLFF